MKGLIFLLKGDHQFVQHEAALLADRGNINPPGGGGAGGVCRGWGLRLPSWGAAKLCMCSLVSEIRNALLVSRSVQASMTCGKSCT